MLERFTSFIESNSLFTRKDNILVAVSGGIDSVVLCHLLHQAKYNLALAHCNFQLRGKNSDDDEAFVSQLATSLNVSIYSKKFETQSIAAENNQSIQLTARELRYDWFYEILEKQKFDLIVTAHHASDQSETVLYNLVKGTGISGLRGIPLENNKVVRPLLFATKVEVIEYAQENNLRWREDLSNQDDKYSRNLIRNKVIPNLKKINPGLEQTMLRNVTRFRSIEDYILSETDKIKNDYLKQSENQSNLDLSWLSKSNMVLLHHLLAEFNFNHFQIEDICKSLEYSGKVFSSNSHQVLIDRKSLIISTSENPSEIDFMINLEDKTVRIGEFDFFLNIKKKKNTSISKEKNIAMLDNEKIQYPIKVRNWKKGDRFIPLGMKSEKKLSDFMIDEKIPVNLKKRLPIFSSNNNIFWIAGHRIDDRFKVTDTTEQVLIIDMVLKDV